MTVTWGTTQVTEQAEATGGFFPSPTGNARVEPLRPPTHFLALAGATALLSWVLALFAGAPMHLVGWALGSLGTVGFVTAYSAVDAKRAQTTLYAALPAAARLRTVVASAGFAAALLHAYLFAHAVAS